MGVLLSLLSSHCSVCAREANNGAREKEGGLGGVVGCGQGFRGGGAKRKKTGF